jgi:hypothetical protein
MGDDWKQPKENRKLMCTLAICNKSQCTLDTCVTVVCVLHSSYRIHRAGEAKRHMLHTHVALGPRSSQRCGCRRIWRPCLGAGRCPGVCFLEGSSQAWTLSALLFCCCCCCCCCCWMHGALHHCCWHCCWHCPPPRHHLRLGPSVVAGPAAAAAALLPHLTHYTYTSCVCPAAQQLRPLLAAASPLLCWPYHCCSCSTR